MMQRVGGSPPTHVVPFVRPIVNVDDTLLAAFARVLSSGRLSNEGPEVAAFENEAAHFLGVERAIAVSSGSAGLFASAVALAPTERRLRRRAALPSFTFVATLSAVVHAGFEPVFVDVDPARWTMDPRALEAALTRHPGVDLVVPVNAYGVPPDLDTLAAVARAKGARVLYDDAHGFGSALLGAPSGRDHAAYDARVISLHATKVLPAGEGGLVIGTDAALDARIRRLRGHGLAPDPLETEPGTNARMSEITAVIARRGLERIEGTLGGRRRDAERMRGHARTACGGAFVPQTIPPDVAWSAANFAVRAAFLSSTATSPTETRPSMDEVISAFDALGIGTRRYFHPPLHHLTRFRDALGADALPVTDDLARTILCLPLHSDMAASDIERVEGALTAVSKRFS